MAFVLYHLTMVLTPTNKQKMVWYFLKKKTGEDNTEEPNQPYEIDFNDLFNNCMSVGVYTLILITVFILALVNN